jgi:hypothetical protein
MRVFSTFAIFVAALSSSAAMAGGGSYTGNWPVTISKANSNTNGTFCMILNDDGSLGRQHSGEAKISGGFGNPTDGQFEVIGNNFVATIYVPSGNGELDYLVFTARVGNGSLGKGIFDYANGAEPDEGDDAFGANGGC